MRHILTELLFRNRFFRFACSSPGLSGVQVAADRAFFGENDMSEIDTFLDGIDAEVDASLEVNSDSDIETEAESNPEGGENESESESSSPELKETDQEVAAHEEGLNQTFIAERRRRQEAEATIKDLELSMQNMREAQNEPREDLDFLEDPNAARDALREEFSETLTMSNISISEEIARDKHDDYEEKIQIFVDEANQNPELWAKFKNAKLPAMYAYKYASRQQKIKALEDLDVDSFEAKIRADERSKGDGAIQKAVNEALAKVGKLPISMSNERASGGNSSPEWGGPPSIDDMLGNKKE